MASAPTTEAKKSLWDGLGLTLTRHWAAIIVLVLGVIALGGIMAGLSGAKTSEPLQQLPDRAQAQQVSDQLERRAANAPSSVLMLFTRKDAGTLTDLDRGAIASLTATVNNVDRGTAAPLSPPIPAPDQKAMLITIPVSNDLADDKLPALVKELRAIGADQPALQVSVTGGPAFRADIARAFDGADAKLLIGTGSVVALLLLITYRSPVLWIFPLLIIGMTDRAAALVAAPVAEIAGVGLDGSVSGITSVLVFGAGTNYALLLISRYREELHNYEDRKAALRVAIREAGPAIAASNITVVLALLALALAAAPATRSLGIVAGVMLLFTLISVGLLLPATLALLGRWVFWPLVPRPGKGAATETGVWYRIARWVGRHSKAVLAASVAGLFVLSAGLVGAPFGLSQQQSFRVKPDSIAALELLSQHFPAGASTPTKIITQTDSAADVFARVQAVPGVGVVTAEPTADATTVLSAILKDAPGTPEALETVRRIRAAVPTTTIQPTLVGGPDAQLVDARDVAIDDLKLIVPIILLVVFIILVVLLRAIVAPVLLIAATSLSAIAALGAGVFLTLRVLGFPAVEYSVMLFSFLFLVALGVDYTIFLMTRAKEEATSKSTRDAVAIAVGATGSVITSAGMVLAAVFVVLGVLPLIVLAQLGAIVCIGILLDTFLVRTLVVPALCNIVGERIWWPAKRPADHTSDWTPPAPSDRVSGLYRPTATS